jgi:hypothetical protein
LLSPEEGRKQARELLDDLLARKPDKNSTNTGEVRIRNADRTETKVQVRFIIYSTSTNWVNVYEAQGDAGSSMLLTVIHPDGQPGEYWLAQPYDPRSATNPPARKLSAAELMTPFAGSDFWLADLGLEFLRWPDQRVLKREMRRSMPCAVLESTHPSPSPSGYSRVVSWIDPESGGIVHADAYDASGELFKVFDPTELGKVEGVRELEEMEMRNRRTRSHTWIKFRFN